MGLARVCGTVVASGVLLAGPTGCSLSFGAGPTTTAPGGDLAADLTSRLRQRNVTVDAGSVRCPAELEDEVGGGRRVPATVTGVDAGLIKYVIDVG